VTATDTGRDKDTASDKGTEKDGEALSLRAVCSAGVHTKVPAESNASPPLCVPIPNSMHHTRGDGGSGSGSDSARHSSAGCYSDSGRYSHDSGSDRDSGKECDSVCSAGGNGSGAATRGVLGPGQNFGGYAVLTGCPATITVVWEKDRL